MILNDIKIKYKEVDIQESIQKLLSNPIRIWNSTDNKRFKILSAGFINPYEGPDLKNISIYYDGQIITGDAEIDLKSSNWYYHNHHTSPNFDKVILHIVLEQDIIIDNNFLSIVLEPSEFPKLFPNNNKNKVSSDDLIVIQEYALFRLERYSNSFLKHWQANDKDVTKSLISAAKSFINRYNNKRRRKNVYTQLDFIKIIEIIELYFKENDFSNNKSIDTKLNNFLELPYPGIGLKYEILINAILPSLYFLKEEKSLFLDWYYKILTKNKYGLLKRRFPNIPQKYVWQQQGMLELIRSSGEERFMVKEVKVRYSLN